MHLIKPSVVIGCALHSGPLVEFFPGHGHLVEQRGQSIIFIHVGYQSQISGGQKVVAAFHPRFVSCLSQTKFSTFGTIFVQGSGSRIFIWNGTLHKGLLLHFLWPQFVQLGIDGFTLCTY